MIVRLLAYSLLIIVMLLLYVKYIESKSIFFPEKKIDFTPAQIGLAFQDVYFITSDKLKINGWFLIGLVKEDSWAVFAVRAIWSRFFLGSYWVNGCMWASFPAPDSENTIWAGADKWALYAKPNHDKTFQLEKIPKIMRVKRLCRI